MQPAADALEPRSTDLKPQPETLPFFSTVTGEPLRRRELRRGHWGRGVRQPVQFAAAVNALAEFRRRCLAGTQRASRRWCARSRNALPRMRTKAPVIASTRREREHESLLETAMDLHRAGVALDFAAMTPSRRLLSLPAYAWDKSRWWNESSDWREGRLAPGGRGLLDVRLPRATPTWIARLDGRHMAFLKDHKVENLVVFPAAGFVEMALEAGAQLFEGRPFVVEDFEIRKPLILPDPAVRRAARALLRPERAHVLDPKPVREGGAWSVHVVGSMRGERTESAFAASSVGGGSASLDFEAMELDGFYCHMSDLGLRYGEEFRPIRELAAGAGKSAGKVCALRMRSRVARSSIRCTRCSSTAPASLLRRSGDRRRTARPRLKLPVRFAQILFLRSPGASSLRRRPACNSATRNSSRGGSICTTKRAGPASWIDGFRAISVAGARRSGRTGKGRDLVYHVDWERTPARPQPCARDTGPAGAAA